MACAVVRSKAVVRLLLTFCLLLLPLWESVAVRCLLCVTLCSFWCCNHLDGEWGGGLVALLGLSSWCLVVVGRPFHAVPRGCLRFVNVVFPDHTHLLFLSIGEMIGAWRFGCCQANRGLPVGFLLLRYSDFFTVEFLSLLYLLFIY